MSKIMTKYAMAVKNENIFNQVNSAKFAEYIIERDELLGISPMINGLVTTSIYILGLLEPGLTNILLTHDIDYKLIFIFGGIMNICFGLVLLIAYKAGKV